jgi:hypothetical protein
MSDLHGPEEATIENERDARRFSESEVIGALSAEVERLTRERDDARAELSAAFKPYAIREVERLRRERDAALRVVEGARAWLRHLEVERQAAYLDGVPGELMDALDEYDGEEDRDDGAK